MARPKGIKMRDEQRALIAKRMVGNSLRRGVPTSEKQKKVTSERLIENSIRKGILHREEDKRKISLGMKKVYREGRHELTGIYRKRGSNGQFLKEGAAA